MVGDGAALLDPARSTGVLNAMMSGMVAAGCIAAMLRRHAPEDEACRAYARYVQDAFVRDVAALSDHYSIFDWWRRWH